MNVEVDGELNEKVCYDSKQESLKGESIRVREKILEILEDNNDEIIYYNGDNLMGDGVISSFEILNIVSDFEEEFDIEIDAKYVNQNFFKNVDTIVEMMQEVLGLK